MTKLAAAIMVHDVERALIDATRAAEFGADLVEFRLDRFTEDLSAVDELIQRSPLPCIITCRPTWEGGDYDGDEATRISLFEHAGLGEAGERRPAYLDVELAAYERSANLRQKVGLVVDHPGQVRPTTTGLILSSHDFERRPDDLSRKIEAMANAPACRVIKVAWRARSLRDNLEAFEIIRSQYKPTIALCMGEYGLASRVLAKKFGALLTFAAVDEGGGTAPGQPTLDQIKRLYRWDAIDAGTAVYGVIGYPVGHSISPAIHNAGFDALCLAGDAQRPIPGNAVYLPMPIPPEYEHFKATVGAWLDMPDLHFRGASITIPHKQNLLRFVTERGGRIEPLAQRIGAANTLSVREDGSLYASNTDYAAALDAVCDALNLTRDELAGKRVALIGAGGAARAVAAGFAHYGAKVTIYNRTLERAQKLAWELEGESASADGRGGAEDMATEVAMPQVAALGELTGEGWDVLINCTPLGMHPNIDATPAPDLFQSPSPNPQSPRAVFDTIYNPIQTRLLRDAKAAGCVTISGVEMFVRQAAAQFELWTGCDAPLDVFRHVVREQLATDEH